MTLNTQDAGTGLTPNDEGEIAADIKPPSIVPFAIWGGLASTVQLTDAVMAHWLLDKLRSGGAYDQPSFQAIANIVSYGSVLLWAISAWAFLSAVFPAKKFLARNGVPLPDFDKTILAFAIPFVNFYLPWKRLADIKKSTHHYLEHGAFQLVSKGNSGIIWVGLFYFVSVVSNRVVGTLPASTMAEFHSLVVATYFSASAWIVSFAVSSFWLNDLIKQTNSSLKRWAFRQVHGAKPAGLELGAVAGEPKAPVETTVASEVDGQFSAPGIGDLRPRRFADQVHEGLRRLTVLIAVVWLAVTIAAAISEMQNSPGPYNPAPVASGIMMIGGSLLGFATCFIVVKLFAWVAKGFANFVRPRRRDANDLLAGLAAAAGAAFLLVGWTLHQSDSKAFESSQALAASASQTQATLSQLSDEQLLALKPQQEAESSPPSVAPAATPTTAQIEFELSKAASSLNATLPKQYDGAVLVSTAAKDRTFTYSYVLDTVPADPSQFIESTRSNLVSKVCADQDMRSNMDELGVSYVYSYSAKGIQNVGAVVVEKSKCVSEPN